MPARPFLEDFAAERYRKGGSTRYFASGIGATSGGTLALVANTLYGFPFFVPTNQRFNEIAIRVTTGISGSVVRLGVYADDGTIAPGRLIADFGTVGSATTGTKTIAIDLALSAGLYWLACVSGHGPTLRSVAVGSLYSVFFGLDSTLGTAWGTMVSRAFTLAALPDPWGTPTIGTAAQQGIFLRKV